MEFMRKYLTGLIVILVVLNLGLIMWGMFGAELEHLSKKISHETRKASAPDLSSSRRQRPQKHSLVNLILYGDPSLPSLASSQPTGATSQRSSIPESDLGGVDGQLIAVTDDSLSAVVASVRPAVVNITAQTPKAKTDQISQNSIYFDTARDGAETNSIGSGVIVDPAGYILTNYHTIERALSIQVSLFSAGKKTYTARIVKENPARDLAVLKIDAPESFAFARLGNSDLIEVADTVLAIGSPFGLEQTVTEGIISDNKRSIIIEGKEYPDLIQTDAAINRGNSGGPLVNIKGEVIGINTAIYAPTGVFSGIGFAIPINQARPLLYETTD